MSGGRTQTTRTNTNQSQTSNSTLGSTSTAMGFLPGFQTAANNALNLGSYSGNVAAGQEMLDQYAPELDPNGSVTRLVADPGAPLDNYMPDVQIQDRYLAGMGDASRSAIDGGLGWINSAMPWMTQGATDMGNFWGDVARGVYLDPNQNQAFQGWLGSFDESMRDDQARNINSFNDQATMAGAYGDSNFARGRTWMADEYDQNRSSTVANMVMNLYNTEMARRERATEGLAGAFDLGGTPYAAMDAIGERQRQGNQLEIDNNLARASELERSQYYDIQDAERRRQDTALREQAGLDNTAALAQWDYNRQAGRIQNNLGRVQTQQSNDQAALTNAQAQHWAQGMGQLDLYNNIFNMLSNPVFGENSYGTMTGSSTSTTSQQSPGWANALGVLGGIGSTVGSLMGGNPFGALAGLFGGGASGAPAAAGGGGTQFAPLSLPQIDVMRYMPTRMGGSYSGSTPWWVQPNGAGG